MKEHPSPKATTQNIVISDPDEEDLESRLGERALSPELFRFLKKLVKTNKWTRKITIPSTHDDVAVVLLFTSKLKEAGLEILIEIHVFFKGQTVVEEWEMLPEIEHPTSLQPGIFNALDIEKVQVQDARVRVDLKVLIPGGEQTKVLKIYDFSIKSPTVHTEALQGK